MAYTLSEVVHSEYLEKDEEDWITEQVAQRNKTKKKKNGSTSSHRHDNVISSQVKHLIEDYGIPISELDQLQEEADHFKEAFERIEERLRQIEAQKMSIEQQLYEKHAEEQSVKDFLDKMREYHRTKEKFAVRFEKVKESVSKICKIVKRSASVSDELNQHIQDAESQDRITIGRNSILEVTNDYQAIQNEMFHIYGKLVSVFPELFNEEIRLSQLQLDSTQQQLKMARERRKKAHDLFNDEKYILNKSLHDKIKENDKILEELKTNFPLQSEILRQQIQHNLDTIDRENLKTEKYLKRFNQFVKYNSQQLDEQSQLIVCQINQIQQQIIEKQEKELMSSQLRMKTRSQRTQIKKEMKKLRSRQRSISRSNSMISVSVSDPGVRLKTLSLDTDIHEHSKNSPTMKYISTSSSNNKDDHTHAVDHAAASHHMDDSSDTSENDWREAQGGKKRQRIQAKVKQPDFVQTRSSFDTLAKEYNLDVGFLRNSSTKIFSSSVGSRNSRLASGRPMRVFNTRRSRMSARKRALPHFVQEQTIFIIVLLVVLCALFYVYIAL